MGSPATRRETISVVALACAAVLMFMYAFTHIAWSEPPVVHQQTAASAPLFTPIAPVTSLPTPCAPPDSDSQWRPVRNGSLLRSPSVRGLGELHVENGAAADATVWLVDDASGRMTAKVFVATGHSAVITGVPSASYYIRFEHGQTYSRHAGRFCHSAGISEFDEAVQFEERDQKDGRVYRTLEISLQPKVGGTARTHALAAPSGAEPDDTIPR